MRLTGMNALPYLLRPKISRQNASSETILLRKSGSAATEQIPRPLNLIGYIPHAAHTAKLLTTKNETDAISEAPITRGVEIESRNIPAPRIITARYHIQATA